MRDAARRCVSQMTVVDRGRPSCVADRHAAGVARRRVQRVSQRRPGRDAELGEDPVQVGRDGARRHVQPGGDLTVGQAGRREQGDLSLLGRE